jgi:hypothetical protein
LLSSAVADLVLVRSVAILASRGLFSASAVALASIVAFLLMWFWTPVAESLTGSFLGGPPYGRQIIDEVWPFRLIQPSWLGETDDLIYRWEVAETKAREITVISLWFIAVTIVVLKDAKTIRGAKDLTKRCS